MRERTHLSDPGVDGKIIIKKIFKNWDGRAWTRLTRLVEVGTGDGRL